MSSPLFGLGDLPADVLHSATNCDDSMGKSYPVIYPGYANALDFKVYNWTYHTIIVPQAWLCVVNSYAE